MRYKKGERKIKSNAELSTDILGHPHYNKIYNRSKTIKAYIYILYIFPEKNITGIIPNTPGLNAIKMLEQNRIILQTGLNFSVVLCSFIISLSYMSLFLFSFLFVLVLLTFFSFLYPSIFVARVKKNRYSLIYNYVTLSIDKNIYPNNLKSPF